MLPEKRKSAGRRPSDLPPLKKIKTPAKESSSKPKESRPLLKLNEPLPTRVNSSKPLPLLRDDLDQPSEALKSVADSGVLAASIERSKTQWITEGLFSKYWTKPRGKKNQAELVNNPDVKSMHKLGLCRIIVEPHVLEASLFTIHEVTSAPKALPKPKQAMIATTPGPSTMQPTQQMPVVNPLPPQASQTTFQANTGVKRAPVAQSVQTNPAPSPSPAPAPPKQPQDPVIQMLAQRASKDSDLKALMQVVASGKADFDQLQVFQSHINELNAILQRQNQLTGRTQTSNLASAPATPVSQPSSATAPSNNTFRTQTPTFTTNHQQATPGAVQPLRPSPAIVKQSNILGIAVEFTGGTGDRFSLPRNSICEYDAHHRPPIMKLSFLLTRKGSAGEGGHYDPIINYYQPVNIKIACDSRVQPTIFDAISRSLLPIEEVRKYMVDTMLQATRAIALPLALQLPVASDSAAPDSSAPPTPIGGKTADRRQSLLKQSTAPISRASPVPDRNTFEETHCSFCFEAVIAPVQKLERQAVCPTCAPLRGKEMLATQVIRRDVGTARQRVPSQALVL